jgi:hypothetical protein
MTELFLPELDFDFEFSSCRILGFTGLKQDVITHTFRNYSSVNVIDLGQFDDLADMVLFEGSLANSTTNAFYEMRMHYLMQQVAQRQNSTVVVTHLRTQSEYDFVLSQNSQSTVFMVRHGDCTHYLPEVEAIPDILLSLL